MKLLPERISTDARYAASITAGCLAVSCGLAWGAKEHIDGFETRSQERLAADQLVATAERVRDITMGIMIENGESYEQPASVIFAAQYMSASSFEKVSDELIIEPDWLTQAILEEVVPAKFPSFNGLLGSHSTLVKQNCLIDTPYVPQDITASGEAVYVLPSEDTAYPQLRFVESQYGTLIPGDETSYELMAKEGFTLNKAGVEFKTEGLATS